MNKSETMSIFLFARYLGHSAPPTLAESPRTGGRVSILYAAKHDP